MLTTRRSITTLAVVKNGLPLFFLPSCRDDTLFASLLNHLLCLLRAQKSNDQWRMTLFLPTPKANAEGV